MLTHQSQLWSWSIGGEGEGTVLAQSWKERVTGRPTHYLLLLDGRGHRLSSRVHRQGGEHRPELQHEIFITWEYKREKTLFIFREVKHWNRSPEGWLDFHPWRCSKLFCAWPWATWSDGTQAGQQDGLGDLCKSPPTYTILWSHLATSCFSGAKRQCFFVSPSPQQQMIQTWKTE